MTGGRYPGWMGMVGGSHKTSIFTDDEGFTHVKYHNTSVVKFKDKEIILDSGGWKTPTTKSRMNQASNQFGLGFIIRQVNFDWLVAFQPKDGNYTSSHPFSDKMKITVY